MRGIYGLPAIGQARLRVGPRMMRCPLRASDAASASPPDAQPDARGGRVGLVGELAILASNASVTRLQE